MARSATTVRHDQLDRGLAADRSRVGGLTGMAIGRLLQRAVESLVYDPVQRLAGQTAVHARIAPHLAALPRRSGLIDVGGGTGLSPMPDGMLYVCVDVDREKLRRFRAKHPRGRALVADATRCPIATASADAVLCSKVTHHLDNRQVREVLTEAARMLRSGGTLILADAVESPRLWSRLLWAIDRGSHPRPADAIPRFLPPTLVPAHVDRFRVPLRHEFVVCVARRA